MITLFVFVFVFVFGRDRDRDKDNNRDRNRNRNRDSDSDIDNDNDNDNDKITGLLSFDIHHYIPFHVSLNNAVPERMDIAFSCNLNQQGQSLQ
jgi:hypothetical protein